MLAFFLLQAGPLRSDKKKMPLAASATRPNQSVGRRQEAADCFAFLRFVSSWDFSPLDRRRCRRLKDEPLFFQRRFLHPLLCSGILFIPGAFLTLNSPSPTAGATGNGCGWGRAVRGERRKLPPCWAERPDSRSDAVYCLGGEKVSPLLGRRGDSFASPLCSVRGRRSLSNSRG